MAELTGQTFAGYEIVAKLGRGGMGAVFKARQHKLNRLAALKVLAPDLASDPDFVARFRREAAAAANLSHPNIVQVYSAGESEGTHYIAMEFVDGQTLRDHIEQHGRLDPREAVAITVYVAEALQYAWNRANLIHRDIKPENIFLSKTGEVKVGDLGLAKTVGGQTTSLTQTGTAMGSPHYISPEQATGAKDMDFRTDIYSLGCTLYHMLTGQTPYSGDSSMVVMMKHVNEPPPAIFKVWPQCPMPLGLLVGKMLAKKTNSRPASYEELIEQLRGLHDKLKPATVPAAAPARPNDPTQRLTPTPKPVVTKTPTVAPKARESKPATRNSGLMIGGAVAAVVLLLGGLFLWSPWKTSTSTPQAESDPLQPGAIRLWDSPDAIAKEQGVTWENSAVVFGSPFRRALRGNAPASRDAIVRAEISMNPDATVRWLGLRYVGVSLPDGRKGENSYRLELKNQSVSLMSVRDSKSKPLQKWELPRTYGPNEWLRLEMRAAGDEVTVSADGHVLGNVRDTSQPEPGCPMIRGENASFRRIVYVPLDKAAGGVDTAFIREVAALPAEQQVARVVAKLKELNPGFDPTVAEVKHEIKNGKVTNLNFYPFQVTDITPVRALPGLESLKCGGVYGKYSPLADLSPLRGMVLKDVNLFGTEVSDLSPLRGMALWRLNCGHTKVTDLLPLEGMPLGTLVCDYNSIRDLSPLRTMPIGILQVDNSTLKEPRNVEILRSIKTLKTINKLPAAEFWKRVEAGKLSADITSPKFGVLFDGRDTSAWQQRDGGDCQWEVRDGALVAGKGDLDTREKFQDFKLHIEFAVPRDSKQGNSGIYLQGRYELQILDSFGKPANNTSCGSFFKIKAPTENASKLADEWQTFDIGLRAARFDAAGNKTANARVSVVHNGKLIHDHEISGSTEKGEPESAAPGPIRLQAYGSPVRFRNISISPVDETATAAPPPDTVWQNAINLLPLIDLQKDAVAGKWQLAANGLLLEKPSGAGVMDLPYIPPEEYDFEIEFTPQGGGRNINQYLAAAGHSFAWKVNAYAQVPPIHGIDLVDGKTSKDRDEANAKNPLTLETGHRYVSRVEVRRGSLRALVNGEEFMRWSGDFNRLSMESLYKLHDDRHIGIGSYQRGVVFHRIEVREVTGKGTFTRGAPATQASEAKVLDLGGGAKIELVAIPPGEFMMGSTPEERAWAANAGANENARKAEGEQPRRTTIRRGFWLGRTEVTVGQWRKFTEETGYVTEAEKKGYASVKNLATGVPDYRCKGASWRDPKYLVAPQDDSPVACISWNDAISFCAWLAQKEKHAGRWASGYVVRLPTEAEWEYACRGGRSDAWFWWGNEPREGQERESLRWSQSFATGPSLVNSHGEKGRNGFGLADMQGNIREWCMDGCDPNGAHEEFFEGDTTRRAIRGGSSWSNSGGARCASRSHMEPSLAGFDVGFRVCFGPDVLGSPAADSAIRNPQSAIVPDAAWQNAINLLPLIDPQKDAVEGTWTRADGGLMSDIIFGSRLQIPYEPPAEYDFLVSFTRLNFKMQSRFSGWGDTSQSLSKDGRQFKWFMGAHGNTWFGFDVVGGQRFDKNPTGVKVDECLQLNRRYTSLIAVRKDSVKAYLDDKLISEWRPEQGALAEGKWNPMPNKKAIGIGSCNVQTLFHTVAVREVTGKGTFTRGAAAAASSGDWTTLPNGWRFGKPANLGPAVNSSDMEMDPCVSGDGLTLLFASSRPGKQGGSDSSMDLWMCRRSTVRDDWESPTNLGPVVNSNSNENDPFLSADGLTLLFSSDRPGGQGANDLWMTTRSNVDAPWGQPVNLGPTVNSPQSEGGPCLSADGLSLFFCLRPGNVGGGDLCVSKRRSTAEPWGAPVNLGPPVNTARNEAGPCLSADGLALFFGSDRVIGKTWRFELWMSTRKSTTEPFGEPINLGEQVNLRDLQSGPALSSDSRTLYFYSNSPRPSGDPDLWQMAVLPPDATTPPHQHSIAPAVDAVFLREVAALPAEQQVARVVAKLKELNPGGEGEPSFKIVNGQVTELQLPYNWPFVDISPVRALAKLSVFNCGCSKVRDISPLRGLPLTEFVGQISYIADLSPLEGMKLQKLMIHKTGISDLSPLAGMPLKFLTINATSVKDLTPLRGMPLTELACDFVAPRDAEVLRSIPTLKKINNLPAVEFWKKVEAGVVTDAFIKEVASLSAEQQVARVVAKLKELNPKFDTSTAKHKIENGQVTEFKFSAVDVDNISPVRALARLRKLSCEGVAGKNSPLADLSPLRGMQLTSLSCGISSVSDLSPLADLPSLTYLSCWSSPLRDLLPLKGMQLNTLRCMNSNVEDLSPLKGMPLEALEFHHSKVADLSPLNAMRLKSLQLNFTEVRDLTPLRSLPLQEITFDFVPQRDTEVLRSIKTLKTINKLPIAEFWKRVEAGESPQPK